MRSEDSRTDLGLIKIHKNVIASIAGVAALEIEGVKRIGGNLKSGLFELLNKNSNLAIRVEFDKNGDVTVCVPLIIKYSYNIPVVSGRVQDNVRNALEKMTNLSIRDININVQGIEKE